MFIGQGSIKILWCSVHILLRRNNRIFTRNDRIGKHYIVPHFIGSSERSTFFDGLKAVLSRNSVGGRKKHHLHRIVRTYAYKQFFYIGNHQESCNSSHIKACVCHFNKTCSQSDANILNKMEIRAGVRKSGVSIVIEVKHVAQAAMTFNEYALRV